MEWENEQLKDRKEQCKRVASGRQAEKHSRKMERVKEKKEDKE